ncbi:MAG: hypothetical protein JKY31_06270 [Rhodobacteraceae bacterium]|nr:hypothetical protein [Paracoccaceae bacterium]
MNLSLAEAKIVAEIDSGREIVLGDGKVPPEDAGNDRKVRASFIRYLALGGCDDCKTHEKGLQVCGALVVGDGTGAETKGLDLAGCKVDRDLFLANCRFPDLILMRDCAIATVNFHGSHLLRGFSANRLEAKGDVLLRQIIADGEVQLLGAKLGGSLECTSSKFLSASRCSLSADRLTAKGNVVLERIKAKSEVRLLGIKLDGDLDCEGAEFLCQSDSAFVADGMKVRGMFYLRLGAKVEGSISLSGAEVGVLSDELDCWPTGKNSIRISRFHYGAILGPNAPVDAKSRLDWLKKIKHAHGFSPQPYEQLAKVLREMGHRSDAREVLIEKERLQRKDRRDREPSVVYSGILLLRDQAMNLTVRYGHRPLLAFAWLAIFWSIGVLVFLDAAENGAFKPSSSRVWQSEFWVKCADVQPSQMECYQISKRGLSYPKFSALIYSADTLLPIVDLELQNVWIPDEAKAPWVRRYLWFQILAGWALSLLAVAGFSGLIKKSD